MAIKNKTQLVLKDKDGKKVVHEKNNLTAGDVLDALECQERMYAENTTAVKQFNELVEFNISLFNSDEVTRESILQGLTNDEAFSALNQPINGLLGVGNIFKVGSSTGVERWRSVAIKALKMTGQYNSANLNALLHQMQTESNGNPKAINNWDSNAAAGIPSKGLMQVIDTTFRSYALPPYNKDIYDPLSNILASIRYTLSRYGSLLNGWRGVGYENGGWIMKDGLFRGGEGNKPEVVVPLTKKTRAIELVGEVLAFLSGKSKQIMRIGQNDNHSEELLALIKQQQQQHNEMMAILKAILGKDFIIKSSDIGKSANSYMGADLAKLRYINGGI